MELNGNTFLITNKKYPHANIAQWGSGGRDMGTYELKVYPDQFWLLKEDSNHPGYYYINNVKWDGYRIAKWGGGDKDVGAYNDKYYEDQMWKFEPVEDDYYRIFNFKYKNARLTKFGKGDGDWGTYSGADYDDQKWKLVPRFKADIGERVIWSCDNRQGSVDFSEEITVTTGLKLTSSSSVSIKVGLEVALKASASFAVGSVEAETKITSEIERSLSESKEESWSRQSKIEFTAPAGKNYRVKQIGCNFSSPLPEDDCTLSCSYTVEQTDSEFPN